MKCPVCGHESDGKFCENCGSPLTQNNTQENTANSVDSFGQNPTPEQPNYDYNTENQSYDQVNQNNNQQYGQGYNNGYGNPNQNGTSYGQKFTNQNGGYNGSQQFTNVPNGQKNNSSKTAIIITSIVGGIIVLLIVIFAVVACNVLPKVIDYADKHVDKAIDDASSYISKDFDKETTVPAFDSTAQPPTLTRTITLRIPNLMLHIVKVMIMRDGKSWAWTMITSTIICPTPIRKSQKLQSIFPNRLTVWMLLKFQASGSIFPM